MNTMYRELRLLGGSVARVIDPRSEHGCDDSRLLVIPFFDAVLTARGKGESPPGALRDMATLEPREMNAANRNDPALTWLPSAEVATLWREFSENGTLAPVKGPLQVPALSATREAGGQVRLSWCLVPELSGGVRALHLYRDGQLWKEIGPAAGKSLATSRDAPPEGLRALPFIDKEGGVSSHGLRFLDAAGHESPLVESEVR